MAKFKINITINADDEKQASEIATKLQAASAKVQGSKLKKMLDKLEKNPSWIDLAVKFV